MCNLTNQLITTSPDCMRSMGRAGHIFATVVSERVCMPKRTFAAVSEEQVEAYRRTTYSQNTNSATNAAERALVSYYESTTPSTSSNCMPYQQLSAASLNSLLERFYISCRTVDNEEYKSSSLRTLRQNLARAIRISHNTRFCLILSSIRAILCLTTN